MKSAGQNATGHCEKCMNSHTRKRQKCNIASVLTCVNACAYRVSTFVSRRPRVRIDEKWETSHRLRSRLGCCIRCNSQTIWSRETAEPLSTGRLGKRESDQSGPSLFAGRCKSYSEEWIYLQILRFSTYIFHVYSAFRNSCSKGKVRIGHWR